MDKDLIGKSSCFKNKKGSASATPEDSRTDFSDGREDDDYDETIHDTDSANMEFEHSHDESEHETTEARKGKNVQGERGNTSEGSKGKKKDGKGKKKKDNGKQGKDNENLHSSEIPNETPPGSAASSTQESSAPASSTRQSSATASSNPQSSTATDTTETPAKEKCTRRQRLLNLLNDTDSEDDEQGMKY